MGRRTESDVHAKGPRAIPSWRVEQVGPSTYEIRRGGLGDGTFSVRAACYSRAEALAWFFEQEAGAFLLHIDPGE